MRSLSLLALVLTLALIPQPPPAAAADSDSFVDDNNSLYQPFIETARAQGLLTGCNPPDNDRVCPHDLVDRGTMAIMLARAIKTPGAGETPFTDLKGHRAEGAVGALTAAGVQMGCDEDRFCPDRPITRGEMATLIARTLNWETTTNTNGYTDVDGSPFGPALVSLASQGGLLACNAPLNTRLCPESTVRREEAALALISALGLEPIDIASEEPGSSRISFDDAFDDLALWDGRSPSSRNRVRLTSAGFRGKGLRVAIPKGSHFGADFHLRLKEAANEETDSLYFRYFLKLDSDWETSVSGKLPGFSGVYGRSGKGGYQSRGSDPGWSARLMFTPARGNDDRVRLGYYVYHLGQETRYGDGMLWNEAGRLRPGQWYCLEGEILLNSLGIADGALRGWVDGTPALDLSGLEFRRPSEPQIKIDSFWFNVYYGGKPTAPKDLGLTIDEVVVDTQRVGCGAGGGTNRTSVGDFNGSGYLDRVWWDACPGGTCFWVEQKSISGTTLTKHQGGGTWFTLETHRVGLMTGDFDGNGLADIVYPGLCDKSVRCWRVHTADDGMETGQDWGDGAWFAESAKTVAVGDWNGDGRDDLAYEGLCGDDAEPCWRVHLSTGSKFASPSSWGDPPKGVRSLMSADIDGDGRDDIVYQAPCDEDRCWYTQLARDGSFTEPIRLGLAEETADNLQWIDFDGDGAADLVAWAQEEEQSTIAVRFMEPRGLGSSVPVAQLDGQIQSVTLRRVDLAVQALVEVACEDSDGCVEYMAASSPQRLTPPELEAPVMQRAVLSRLESLQPEVSGSR
jgi:hypothetical protein